MPSRTKPDLLDRYLHAVKFWLPKAQQDDILAELAEDLRSQIEEREAALGHPLDEAGLADLLKQRGSPMRVASSYIPEQRLINPAMLPVYRLVLKIVLLWVLAPLFALILIGSIFHSAHPWESFFKFWADSWPAGFTAVGIVTVIFALLDRYQSEWVDTWDPRKLPRVPISRETTARRNDIAGFLSGIVAFLFWGSLMWHRSEIVFQAGPRFILGTIFNSIYWPVLGLTLARAGVDLVSFLRPAWRAVSYMRLALDGAVILMAGLLLRVGTWLEISEPHLTAAQIAKAMPWINGLIQLTLVFVIGSALVDVFQQVRRLRRGRARQTAPLLIVS
jgi:hypothetical protein